MHIEWTLTLFTVVAGTGAWLFVASALGELAKKEKNPSKIEAIVSFILLVIGGCISVLHLKHPDRILEALNRPTSGIFIEAAMIGVMCVIIAIYFIMVLRKSSPKARMVVAAIGVVIGIVFSYECGASYMMSARPTWVTIALPLSYAGTVAAAGTTLNLMIKAILKREKESIKFAGMLALIGCALGLVCAGVFHILAGETLFTSEYDVMPWIIATYVGIIIAFAGSLIAMKQSEKGTVPATLAVIGAIVAAVAVRASMWLLGTPLMDFFHMVD